MTKLSGWLRHYGDVIHQKCIERGILLYIVAKNLTEIGTLRVIPYNSYRKTIKSLNIILITMGNVSQDPRSYFRPSSDS